MRTLFLTGSPARYMSPPLLGDEQINGGPDWLDERRPDGRWQSMATSVGEYDVAKLVAKLPRDQAPDLVVCLVDASWRNVPRNLRALKCPKVLLVADTHHLQSPLLGMLRYLANEPFDRIVLLYDRHHLPFFRAAGCRNLYWFPGLTFPHSDSAVRETRKEHRGQHIGFVGQIGKHHPRRALLLAAMRKRGLPVVDRVIGQAEALKFYGEALLGFNASLNGDLNLRVFELLASGAGLVTDRLAPTSGLTELLRDGREMTMYGSAAELADLVSSLLSRPAEARALGNAGARWFDEHFSEVHRRTAFQRLAFDGVAAFPLVEPEPTRVFFDGDRRRLLQSFAAYERVQELHRTQETIQVTLDSGVPEDVCVMLGTLPRVVVSREVLPSTDVAVLSQTDTSEDRIEAAAHVWYWDAAPADRAELTARLRSRGFDSMNDDLAFFRRTEAATSESLTADEEAAQGRAAFERGDFATALAAARSAFKREPRCVAAMIVLGDLALKTQGAALAEKLFRQARSVAPKEITAAVGLAEALVLQGKHREAALIVSAMLRRAPDDPRLKAAMERAKPVSPAAGKLAPPPHVSNSEASAPSSSSSSPGTTSCPAAAVGADYSRSIKSALQSGRAWDALGLVKKIVADRALQHAAANELLISIFAAAAKAGAPKQGGPPRPRQAVIMAYQPWFGLDFRRLIEGSWDQGILLPLFHGVFVTKKRKADGLTAANVQTFSYRGLNLWAICQYQVALVSRAMPREIDPRNPERLAAIQQIYGEAMDLIDEANAFVAAYRPESVVVAQGYNLVAAVLRHVAVQSGLRVVALENTFHAERLLWDDTSGVAVNLNLAKNYYWRYREFIAPGIATATTEAYFNAIQTLKSAEHKSPTAALPAMSPDGRRTITYIGQVGTDASVLFGLRGFGSQVEIISALAEYAAERSLRLLVKLHPKESPTYGYAAPHYRNLTTGWLERDARFQAAKTLLGEHLVIDAENQFNTYEMIRRADACVTITSQAGLEALLLGKEVLLCGEAFYGGLGFTHEVQDESSLRHQLGRVLDENLRVNEGVRCRTFFHVFNELYCLPKTEESLLRLITGRPIFPAMGASSPAVPAISIAPARAA